MSVRDTEIDKRLLESASKVFLEKGFVNAGLSEICEKAGVTTGAVYKRYAGKAELFEDVVKPAIEFLDSIASSNRDTDFEHMNDEELLAPWRTTLDSIREWFRLLNQIRDPFVMLISYRAEGTKYENFHHEWVEKMTDYDYAYYEQMKKRNLVRDDISEREMHAVLSAYWEMFYEPFIHGFTDKELEKHYQIILDLFDWERFFRIK